MKRLALAVVAIGLAGSLAACAKKETTTEPAAPAAATSAALPAAPASANADMAAMGKDANAKMAKGRGTVTAVGADSITIDHEAIPEAQWPAMTMGFKAAPDLVKRVKVGDKISFDLQLRDGAGEITAINKQ